MLLDLRNKVHLFISRLAMHSIVGCHVAIHKIVFYDLQVLLVIHFRVFLVVVGLVLKGPVLVLNLAKFLKVSFQLGEDDPSRVVAS